MTTAHRPTWTPAIATRDQGGNRSIAPSNSYSSRDLPGHKTLKVRQPGQNTLDEIARRNLKEELLEKEQKARRKRLREEGEDSDEEPLKKPKLLEDRAFDYSLDADDSSSDGSSDDSDGTSSDSDSSDDEAEIRRELAKIKAERAAQQAQKAQEEEEVHKITEHEQALRENPLLWKDSAPTADYSLEKKWYEDVVFKNQARDQPVHKKRFINDTVRNDFHRKFLNKYVQ